MEKAGQEGAERANGIHAPGFRLPADTRLGAVRLQVSDLERSLAWYGRVLGLGALERSAGRAVLGSAGQTSALVELHERPGARPVPQQGRLGLYHFAILLPDRAALGAFVAHLAAQREPAGASDHLVSEAIYLRDPDGLGIEVYADRPRTEWRHRDGQLVMATEPLDLGDVMAAAREAWSGMPPGTVLGHVHLHVGDLGQAEAFYHAGLGLDKVVWSYPGALFLSAGGYHHHLGLNTWARGAAPVAEDEARLLEWELLLPSRDDCEQVQRNLASRGVSVSWSGGEAVARDPWGTQLRVRPA